MTQQLHVSPQGDDQATGSAEAPMRTLNAAAAKAEPGTIIELAAGVHCGGSAACLENVSGLADQPIIIRGPRPMPIDFHLLEALDKNLYVLDIRKALAAGRFALGDTAGLAVIEAAGEEVGLALTGCSHLRLENLVVRQARVNLMIRHSQAVTVRDCVFTGDPPHSQFGVMLQRDDMDEQPSTHIRFERVSAYNLKETGFVTTAGAAMDSQWHACIAHTMHSSGGDGFAFNHVSPADPPQPCRVFADGIDYRAAMLKCVAINNRLDGFDIGHGVGGVHMDLCLGDGNGHGAYYAKDIKVWSSNNTFVRCRMTGRILFVDGINTLRDFKTGVAEEGPNP